MKGIKIVTEDRDFYFSEQTNIYGKMQLFFGDNYFSRTLKGNDLKSFKEYIKSIIDHYLEKFHGESRRRKLSRIKKIEYNQNEYELNLSDDSHLYFFNLISILEALILVENGEVFIEFISPKK